jgi:hypothetical protein
VKVFELSGKLYVKEDLSHQELLNLLYKLYKQFDIRFTGVSKDVTSEYVESEKYIRVY